MIVILDNGHGVQTLGKRSPDGRLREYAYTREITKKIKEKLNELKVESILLVPEEDDISLSERCERANKIYDECGGNCTVISVHINAAADGSQWLNAKGWSCFIYRYSGDKTKKLASCITEAAKEEGLKIRYEYPGVPYWVSGLYICKHTKAPCVLTENLFQDNKDEVDFLLSEKGKEVITNLHVQGIIKYLEENE